MSETLIYHWINQKPRYGKELIKLTKTIISDKIKTPTIYAILNRGKSQGLLVDFIKPDKDKITRGIERKYYRLSEEGKEYYHQLKLYLDDAKYLQELLQSGVSTSIQPTQELYESIDLKFDDLTDSKTQTSLSKLDFSILGYLNLNETTTYDAIREDMNYTYEDVLQSISILRIFHEIEEKSSFREEAVILNLKQKQSNLFNLVFDKIDKSVYSKIDGMTFEDILNMKLIAGILLLKREIESINYLLQYFIDNEIPILSNIKHEALLQYLGLISLNQYLNIQITSEGWILTNKGGLPPIVEENTILPGYDWINYNELIGWLSTIRTTNLRNITNKINNQGIFEFKLKETLLIIALLVTDGVLEGNIEEDSTLHIIDIHKNIHDTYLSKNERILLGFIKSYSQKKLKDLAAILDIKMDEVRQLTFQFMGRSNISFEIARDGALIIRDLGKLPIQIQPLLLNNQLQELYGYLAMGQTIEISKLESIWEKSNRLIKSELLELVGYGLIDANINKKQIKIISKQKSQILALIELSDHQKTLIQKLDKWSEDQIVLSDFSDYLKTNTNYLIKDLCVLVTIGIYPNAYFEKEYFVKNGSAIIKLQLISCEDCGTKMQSYEKICPNCKNERSFCIVCRGLIEENEIVNSCPNCLQKGHKEHFASWLVIRSECPACRTNINVHQLEGIK